MFNKYQKHAVSAYVQRLKIVSPYVGCFIAGAYIAYKLQSRCIRSLMARIAIVNGQLDSLVSDHDIKLNNQESTIGGLGSEVTSLRDQIDAKNKIAVEINDSLCTMSTKFDQQQQSNRDLQKHNSDQKDKIQALEDSNAFINAELSRVNGALYVSIDGLLKSHWSGANYVETIKALASHEGVNDKTRKKLARCAEKYPTGKGNEQRDTAKAPQAKTPPIQERIDAVLHGSSFVAHPFALPKDIECKELYIAVSGIAWAPMSMLYTNWRYSQLLGEAPTSKPFDVSRKIFAIVKEEVRAYETVKRLPIGVTKYEPHPSFMAKVESVGRYAKFKAMGQEQSLRTEYFNKLVANKPKGMQYTWPDDIAALVNCIKPLVEARGRTLDIDRLKRSTFEQATHFISVNQLTTWVILVKKDGKPKAWADDISDSDVCELAPTTKLEELNSKYPSLIPIDVSPDLARVELRKPCFDAEAHASLREEAAERAKELSKVCAVTVHDKGAPKTAKVYKYDGDYGSKEGL